MLIGVETWMNEMADIRERIAQHTEEKRTVWLRQIHRRYSVWMFISGVFAVLVTLAAIVAKSLLFGVVAAFLCMFAWNRWGECRRVENWLSRPTPENEKDRIIWARTFYDEMSHPSLWLRIYGVDLGGYRSRFSLNCVSSFDCDDRAMDATAIRPDLHPRCLLLPFVASSETQVKSRNENPHCPKR